MKKKKREHSGVCLRCLSYEVNTEVMSRAVIIESSPFHAHFLPPSLSVSSATLAAFLFHPAHQPNESRPRSCPPSLPCRPALHSASLKYPSLPLCAHPTNSSHSPHMVPRTYTAAGVTASGSTTYLFFCRRNPTKGISYFHSEETSARALTVRRRPSVSSQIHTQRRGEPVR